MKTAKIFSANVNGTFTQIKAFKKSNAVARFKEFDSSIKNKDVSELKSAINSHQAPIDDN